MPRVHLSSVQRHAAASQIRQCHLFADLEDAELESLMQTLTIARLSEDEVLFRQEQPAQEIFLLLSGRLKLLRQSPGGQEKIIDLIAPGMTFAEAVIFSRQKVYPVAAIALMDSDVRCVNGSKYVEILRNST